ncbi:bestrophin family protein [Planctellipticum variicoloris]|uniref:bestrophin family protein n=1 Tax=Planctellipticum variicoloris TaxID=3064265 RepID=UPI003013948F|nr:hypothetical protein SH412_000254 [Planctomycetaceae bacterium SH412]
MTKYDPHRWTDHLFDVEGSMVREILGRVSLCVLWSVIVVSLHMLLPEGWFDLAVPETAHALIGAALGLLLVFRTNASYDRFWEGRKFWGGIVNETRNLARLSSTWIVGRPDLARQILLWTIAFPWSAMYRLRGSRELGNLRDELPPDQVAAVVAADHVPLAVARRITALIEDARADGAISDIQQSQIDQNVQLLIDYLGGCERIRSTPLPFAYAVHLRRALMAYCFTLPLALVSQFGWDTIIVTLLLAYVLFGIEEIGVEIEDPFGTDDNDLPLDEICRNIEGNLRDILPRT